jgi:hypothetical protein
MRYSEIPRPERNPGKMVKWTNQETGEVEFGRTYNSDPITNGKVLVYGLTKNFKLNGKKLIKDPKTLSICGMID